MWSQFKAYFAKLKALLEDLMERYGKLAIITWFTIFFSTWAAFFFLIRYGVQFESAAGEATVFWGAYAATRVTWPIRVVVTLVSVPVIDRWWRKMRGKPEPAAREATE